MNLLGVHYVRGPLPQIEGLEHSTHAFSRTIVRASAMNELFAMPWSGICDPHASVLVEAWSSTAGNHQPGTHQQR